MPKLEPHKVILVDSIPDCDFCASRGDTKPGPYDFRTVFGMWGNGCKEHWMQYAASPTLGTGNGQLWVTKDQVTEE